MLEAGGGGGGEAVGLFPYAEDEELSASPATIEGLADEIQTGGGNVESINEDIDSAHLPATEATSGDIEAPVADATMPAKNNAERLLASTLCASGALRLFGRDGVQAYNDLVDDIRSEYYERKAEIMASDQGVPAASYPQGATDQEKATIDSDRQDEVDTAREGAVAGLVRELRERQGTYQDDPLDSEAETAATRLREGPTLEVIQALYSGGGLPLSAVTDLPSYQLEDVPLNDWPPELADATDQEKADWLLDHPELGSVLAMNASEEVQQLVGEGLAEQARGLDHDSSAEDIERLNNQLTNLGLAVNAEFVKALGGDGLVRLVSTLGQNAYIHNDSGEAAQELAFTLKGAAETASYWLDEDEAREIADEMVDAVEHNDTMENQSVALSFLLRDGNYETEFLDTMGDRLDAFERSDEFQRGGWSQMGSGPNGVGWFFGEDDAEAAFDPLASYMTALGNNDEAALQFFTEGGEDEDGVDRQEYWIQQRVWGHDNFTGLLSALDAATTGENNLDDPETAEQAARLMSSTVDYLANRDKLDHNQDGEDFNPGDVSGEGTEHLAHMIGTYMASVDQALEMKLPDGSQLGEVDQLPGGGRFGEDGLANMPIFEASELKGLINVAVSEDEGFLEMRGQLSTYQAYQMHQSIDEHGYIAPEYSNADARLEGFFVNAVGDTDIAEAEERDQRVQAWLDLGSSVAGAIPVPGASSLAEFAVSSGIDFTASQLSDALTNAEGAQVDESNNYANAALDARKDAFASALYDGGAVTTDDVYSSLPEGSGYSREDVEAWFPNGEFPSPDEYAQMSGDEQNALDTAMRHLISREDPDNPDDHALVDLNEYDQNYEDMFSEYFERGDGEGN